MRIGTSRFPIYHLVLGFLLISCSRKPITFHVAPEGSDAALGTLSDPFGSLERAQRAIRELDNGSGSQVRIREGTYHMSKPLIIDSDDGGSKEAPIVWTSYAQENVFITGGIRLQDFQKLENEEALSRLDPDFHKHIVQIDLTKYGISDYGGLDPRKGNRMELYFNQDFMQVARYPNEGWLTIASVPQQGEEEFVKELTRIRHGVPVGRHFGRFRYETDRPSRWKDRADIWMHGYWVWDWSDEYQQIARIDKINKEVYPQKPYHRYGYHQHQRYYFLNVLEELDQPGEWYLDRSANMLYFWPPSSLQAAEVWLSVQNEPLINCKEAAHIHFKDLHFQYSRGNGIVVDAGHDLQILDCTFSNLGGLPVDVKGGMNHLVSACKMYQLAMGGISIEGGDRQNLRPGGHRAHNNHIHHFAQKVKTYQPAIATGGVGNIISHNVIHDAPHMAMGFGGNDHIIEYNEVFQVLTETSDAGAIYNGRDWTERGTIIRYNYFHDLGANIEGEGFHGVMGVYLDDCLPGTLIQGNIFQNIDRGIMLGGGQYNKVVNNIFIDCDLAIHVDARAQGWARKYAVEGGGWEMQKKLALVPYKDPPWSTKYPELISILDQPYSPIGVEIKNNISQGGRWLDMLQGTDFDTIQIRNNLTSHEEIVKWSNSKNPQGRIHSHIDDDMVLQKLVDRGNILLSPDEKIVSFHANQLEILMPELVDRIEFESIPLDSIGLQGSMKKEM